MQTGGHRIIKLELKRINLIELLVVIFALGTFLASSQDWIYGIRRSWVGKQIIESYRRSAAQGEVVLPATNSGSLSCSAMCFYSMPYSVTAKNAEGTTFHYWAERGTNSAAWTFRFDGGEDVNGNWFTNEPNVAGGR